MSQKHLIQKLILEIHVPEREQAREIQDELIKHYQKLILNELTNLFDALIAEDEHIVVEKLELELGFVSQEEVYEQIPVQVKQQMEESLTHLLFETRQSPGQRTSISIPVGQGKTLTVETVLQKKINAAIDILAYFLEHGIMPWNVDKSTNLNELVERVLKTDSALLKQKLIPLFKHEHVKKRLERQFSETQLLHLISKWSDLPVDQIQLIQNTWTKFISLLSDRPQEDSYVRNFLNLISKGITSNNTGAWFGQLLVAHAALQQKILLAELLVFFSLPASQKNRVEQILVSRKKLKDRALTAWLHRLSELQDDRFFTPFLATHEATISQTLNIQKEIQTFRAVLNEDGEALSTYLKNTDAAIDVNLETKKDTDIVAPKVALESSSEFPDEAISGIYIDNAGLVLLTPFLSVFFQRLGYLNDKRTFISEEIRERAALLLHHLVCGEASFQVEEHHLLLNKLMCGFLPESVLPNEFTITNEEQELSDELLKTVISRWEIIKRSSPSVFQKTFLQHEGRLTKVDEGWELHIERTAFDVMIDKLPWGISISKFTWGKTVIYTTW
jgi:hypothetical protein